MTANPFSQQAFLRTVLDTLPLPVFIADEETRILDVNSAAAKMEGTPPEEIIQHLCGKVLKCLNESNSTRECGQTDECPDCIIRQTVLAVINGEHIVRRKADMLLIRNEVSEEVYFLVTASPFTYGKKILALLTLEDISELTDLRKLIPICAHCKKIRDQDEIWESAEKYFEKYTGVSYTHGLCPDCFKNEYGLHSDKAGAD